MDSVGISDLRQRTSELLRRVQGGETIQITNRGLPVAVLGPLPDDPLDRLRTTGDFEVAEGDLTQLPEPLVLPAGYESPSSVLARLRRGER